MAYMFMKLDNCSFNCSRVMFGGLEICNWSQDREHAHFRVNLSSRGQHCVWATAVYKIPSRWL